MVLCTLVCFISLGLKLHHSLYRCNSVCLVYKYPDFDHDNIKVPSLESQQKAQK